MRRCMFRLLFAAVLGLGFAGTVLAQAPAKPATPAAAQPMIIDATPVVAADACASQATPGGRIQTHFTKPRPPLDCLGCGNWRCEWRFMFGACRAFFDEGRFDPNGGCPSCRR